MDDNLLLPSRSRSRFPYTFVTRYCPCGKLYSLQLDRRTNAFISAATHLDSSARQQVIVTVCPDCGKPIDGAWLNECLAEKPTRQGSSFAAWSSQE